jgi:tetratricopeptide (TPR) repeat protein
VAERKAKQEPQPASLYERYKDALRRGHVAALRGRLEPAIDAYGEAATIAGDRALPHAAIGGIFVRMGKMPEALEAYDRALAVGPRDESSLRGRADVLRSLRRPVEAASSLDRLAEVLESAGRLPDACDAARRSLELAESKERRRYLMSLAVRLREVTGDPAADQALAQALRFLEPPAAPESVEAAAPEAEPPAEPAPTAKEKPETPAVPAPKTAKQLEPVPAPETETQPDQGPAPEPERRLANPVALGAAGEDALYSGDPVAARGGLLAAAYGYRRTGRWLAAIDACYLALAVAPAGGELHLMLAELYLDAGWRALAVDKLVLLTKLAELDGDPTTRERVCRIASDRLPDEPRLMGLCA